MNVETYQNSQNFAASQKIKVIPNVETYQLHKKNEQYVIAASQIISSFLRRSNDMVKKGLRFFISFLQPYH